MDQDSAVHYMRSCERALERMDLTPQAVTTHYFESKTERFSAWCIESVFSGIRALTENDPVLAVRCALQAADYVGRLDGQWPNSYIGDAFLFLRNELEHAVAASIRKVA